MDSPTNEKIVSDVLERHSSLSQDDKRKYSSDVTTFVNDLMTNKPGTSKSVQNAPSSKILQNIYVNDSSDEENPLLVDSSSKMSSSNLRFGAPQLKQDKNSELKVEDEKIEFASCIMSRFKSLSPKAKSETRENVDTLLDSLFPSQGSAAKKRKEDKEDDIDEDEESFKSSTLYRELVKSSEHGGCDLKAEAHLDLETAVISKKRGRPAHCGNPRCHAYLAVNHHVLIMIGRYGKYFKKVFYCCQDECAKNRNILDCTKSPKIVVVSCAINKKEKANLLKDFPNMSEKICPSCR